MSPHQHLLENLSKARPWQDPTSDVPLRIEAERKADAVARHTHRFDACDAMELMDELLSETSLLADIKAGRVAQVGKAIVDAYTKQILRLADVGAEQ